MQTLLQDQLEILIPTYNRREHLLRTLTQLTAPESPVRHCSLTVLDNACTDGSSDLIEEFAAKCPNIKHIRHEKNIGGNGNIARAFELARKPYVWVVCDDDSFRWEAWPEIENALFSNEYDILLTRKDDLKGSSELAKIVRQLTFLPAGIYRTSNITGGVLMNMLSNIPNMFPHLALVCAVLNKKGRIFLPQGEIMDKCTFSDQSGDECSVRGYDEYPHPFIANMFWTVGFLNSLQLIEDKKLHAYILENVGNHGFFGYILGSFRKNYTRYGGNELNIAFVKSGLTGGQRVKFLLARMLLRVVTLFSHKRR